MIELGHFEDDYLTICKHYRAVYDTPCVLEDSTKRKEVYIFLICSLLQYSAYVNTSRPVDWLSVFFFSLITCGLLEPK